MATKLKVKRFTLEMGLNDKSTDAPLVEAFTAAISKFEITNVTPNARTLRRWLALRDVELAAGYNQSKSGNDAVQKAVTDIYNRLVAGKVVTLRWVRRTYPLIPRQTMAARLQQAGITAARPHKTQVSCNRDSRAMTIIIYRDLCALVAAADARVKAAAARPHVIASAVAAVAAVAGDADVAVADADDAAVGAGAGAAAVAHAAGDDADAAAPVATLAGAGRPSALAAALAAVADAAAAAAAPVAAGAGAGAAAAVASAAAATAAAAGSALVVNIDESMFDPGASAFTRILRMKGDVADCARPSHCGNGVLAVLANNGTLPPMVVMGSAAKPRCPGFEPRKGNVYYRQGRRMTLKTQSHAEAATVTGDAKRAKRQTATAKRASAAAARRAATAAGKATAATAAAAAAAAAAPAAMGAAATVAVRAARAPARGKAAAARRKPAAASKAAAAAADDTSEEDDLMGSDEDGDGPDPIGEGAVVEDPAKTGKTPAQSSRTSKWVSYTTFVEYLTTLLPQWCWREHPSRDAVGVLWDGSPMHHMALLRLYYKADWRRSAWDKGCHLLECKYTRVPTPSDVLAEQLPPLGDRALESATVKAGLDLQIPRPDGRPFMILIRTMAPSCTAITQPADQGFIKHLKHVCIGMMFDEIGTPHAATANKDVARATTPTLIMDGIHEATKDMKPSAVTPYWHQIDTALRCRTRTQELNDAKAAKAAHEANDGLKAQNKTEWSKTHNQMKALVEKCETRALKAECLHEESEKSLVDGFAASAYSECENFMRSMCGGYAAVAKPLYSLFRLRKTMLTPPKAAPKARRRR